jgi:alpha-amylase
MEEEVLAAKDPDLTHAWAKMQTSDHFYWMSTKDGTDGSVHQYFSPYGSAYDAYIYFMNALADLQIRVKRIQEAKRAGEQAAAPATD